MVKYSHGTGMIFTETFTNIHPWCSQHPKAKLYFLVSLFVSQNKTAEVSPKGFLATN